MFSIFKSNISLCEVLRTGFTDYHSHVLPGIDDGASHINISKELLSQLQAMGAHTIYCTPHVMHAVYNNTAQSILAAYEDFNKEIQDIGVDIKVAAEYMLDDGFSKHIQNGQLLSYGNREVLVEMNYIRAPMSLHKHMFDLRTLGYTPVLAHPERYDFYHDSIDNYERLREMGCKFQLNLLSLSKYYGPKCNKVATQLLQNGFYTHIGTDTHKQKHIDAIRSIKIKKQQAACLDKILDK